MSIRPVKRVIESKSTIEGAGVKLRRAFGFGDTGEFDPIVMNTQAELQQAFAELNQGMFIKQG